MQFTSAPAPVFLKLGGSLLTDKTAEETVRWEVVQRVAAEIARAAAANRQLQLVLGHGSGSFGHTHGSRHGTREGVQDAAGWHGFCAVADAAARLNRVVLTALLEAGVPAITYRASSSGVAYDGHIQTLALEPIQAALDAGLVVVVHGDVMFDRQRGGTIASTEEIMAYLVPVLRPRWLLLAGETEGVYDEGGKTIPSIRPQDHAELAAVLGGSRGTDVTGGMASKVAQMVRLVEAHQTLSVQIFSGLKDGGIEELLGAPGMRRGTVIEAG